MGYEKQSAEQRAASHKVHELCDRHKLQLQFKWDVDQNRGDLESYVVVDASVPLSRSGQAHCVTSPATIEGTLDQLEQLQSACALSEPWSKTGLKPRWSKMP